jgi:S-adenosylmethionine decarboxylase
VKFGEHVTIDGYGGDPTLLNTEEVVRRCLTELCEQLGMHALTEPKLINAPDNAIKDPGGWSGFVIIHTFPKRRFVSADVYTCKSGMDQEFIANYFKKLFKLEDVEMHFIDRGTRYPDNNIM